MEKMSRAELTLFFLLNAALCLEANKDYTFYLSVKSMNWTDARQYCQREHTDLAAWHLLFYDLGPWLGKTRVWVGLLRDPEQDSVWKWINLETGEGISGDDVSQSSAWADGEPKTHCAAVGQYSWWYSFPCSMEKYFYCSVGNQTHYSYFRLNWHRAANYCQEKNGYLATVNQMNRKEFQKQGWIGLYRTAGENWSWVGNVSSNCRNWKPNVQPNHSDCGSFRAATEELYSIKCTNFLQALCFEETLVVVNESKTWEDAVKHCREMKMTCAGLTGPCKHRYDLLSLSDPSDYRDVRNKITSAITDEVWIGLRFLGGDWWWLSGAEVEHRHMLPDCPPKWKHCGTVSKHDRNIWIIRSCSEKRNFVCSRRKIWWY